MLTGLRPQYSITSKLASSATFWVFVFDWFPELKWAIRKENSGDLTRQNTFRTSLQNESFGSSRISLTGNEVHQQDLYFHSSQLFVFLSLSMWYNNTYCGLWSLVRKHFDCKSSEGISLIQTKFLLFVFGLLNHHQKFDI